MMKDRPTQRCGVVLHMGILLCLVLGHGLGVTWATQPAKPWATIDGVVSDEHGDPVAGARVDLREESTFRSRSVRTDLEGRFRLAHLHPGRYGIFITAPGFSALIDQQAELRGGEIRSLKIQLRVASITDGLVVTATRSETLASEVGVTIDTISFQQLEQGNHTTVAEALRMLPGVTVVQTGRRGGLTSVFTRGGESDYNRVMIDGVPVNEAGGAFDFAGFTPENLDRIEVVRGPQSGLYGSDAVSSTIQLFTRQGTTRVPELSLSGEGGSYGFTREVARLGGAISRFDYSTSYSYQRTGGIDFNDDFVSRVASGRFGFRLHDRAFVNLSIRSENASVGIIGPTERLYSDPDERQESKNVYVTGALETVPAGFWHQRIAFVYAESDRVSFDPVAQDLTNPARPPLAEGDFGVDFEYRFRAHHRRHGLHYQSVFALSSKSNLIAGFEVERETGNLDGVRPERDNLGWFALAEWPIHTRFFLRGGVRMEYNRAKTPADLASTLLALGSTLPVGESGFGLSVNPHLSAAVFLGLPKDAVLGGTRVRFNVGSGIKEPTLVEAFSPNFFFLGNPLLKPERSTSLEAAADQFLLGQRIQLTAAFFENRFRDLITYEYDPATFGPITLPDGRLTNFKNTDRAIARGLEVVATARPHRQVLVSGSYTLLASRIVRAEPVFDFAGGQFIPDPELGLPLIRRPRHSGTVGISWQNNRTSIGADVVLIGARRDIDPVTGARFDNSGIPLVSQGFSKLNLSASYRIAPPLTLFVRTENALNQRYQEVLGYPAYRVNFSIGARVVIGGDR